MISWIQRNFHQHFKFLFLLLLGGVIVAFVFTIGAMPSSGAGGQHRQSRDFFGIDLNSRDSQELIFGDAQLSISLQTGYNALNASQLQQYALTRFAGINLASELKLPAPTDKEIAQYVQTLRMFHNEAGSFDHVRYDEFRDSLHKNPRLTEADVGRVLSDDVVFEQVQALLSGPGYVLNASVTEQLTLTDSKWTIDVANIDAASFSPEITLTDEALADFFADNIGRYEIPAQVGVNYIPFPIALASVAVNDDELLTAYQANPSRFPKPEEAKVDVKINPDSTPDADFAAVKPQVEAYVRRQKAVRAASQAAANLALALFESKITPEALPDYLAKQDLTLKSVAAFSAADIPSELAGIQQLANATSRLSATQPYSDALVGPDKTVILVWRESIPARQPELSEVKAQVTADLTANLKRERFVTASNHFRNDLATRIKSGIDFVQAASLAAKAADLKVDTQSYTDFTLSTPPEGLDYSALNALQYLGLNDLSPVVTTSREKALLVHVAAKQLPDLTADNPRFAEIKTQLSSLLAARGGNDTLNDMVESELTRNAPRSP